MLLRYSSDPIFRLSTSTLKMSKISDTISRNFSPTQPVKASESPTKPAISSQQLLEVSNNISLYYAPKPSSTHQNITLLSINPEQLYIYWNLGENNAHLLPPSMNHDNLILRIDAQDNFKGHSKVIFETPIYAIQHQKKVTLPLTNNNAIYSAKIGSNSIKNKFEPIVVSNKLAVLKDNTTAVFSSTEHNHTSTLATSLTTTESRPTSINIQAHYFNSNHSGKGKKSLK